METVSVIVTVYNLESYLEETLRSVMAQTYPALEIICVDDGSTDGSPAILSQLAAEDDRIRVITQANAGVGEARNAGLAAATGTYVMILDGDDVFEPTMVERLMSRTTTADKAASSVILGEGASGADPRVILGEGASGAGVEGSPVDVVVCRAEQFDNATGATRDMAYSIRMEQVPRHDPFAPIDMADYVFSAFVGWPWDKLYRREFLVREGLMFPALRNSEDLCFVFPAIALAGRVSILDEVLIHHRMNRTTSVSGSRLAAPDEFYRAICLLKNRLRESPTYGRLEWGFLNWAVDYALWNIITLPAGPQRADLVKRLVTGEFTELELDRHGKEYFGLYPRTDINFDLLRAEYEGVAAPPAGVEDVRPRLGLAARALTTAHHFGWSAAKWQFDEWKARRAVSGSEVTAVKATWRGRSHWNLGE